MIKYNDNLKQVKKGLLNDYEKYTARLCPNDIIKARDYINELQSAKNTIKKINNLIELAKDGNQKSIIALTFIDDAIKRFKKDFYK